MATAIDPLGRCAVHPFVQLQRLSKRTGRWKALLDSCPLCEMDDSASARAAPKEEDEVPPAEATPPTLRRRMGQEKPREEESSHKKVGADKVNKQPRRSRSSHSEGADKVNKGPRRTTSDESHGTRINLRFRRSQSFEAQEGADKVNGTLQRSNSVQSHGKKNRSSERATPAKSRGPRLKGASLDSRRSYQSSAPRPKDGSLDSRRSNKSNNPRHSDASLEGRWSCKLSKPRSNDASLDNHRSDKPSKPSRNDASLDSRRSYQSSKLRPKNASLESQRSYQPRKPERGDARVSSQNHSRSNSVGSSDQSGTRTPPPHPPPLVSSSGYRQPITILASHGYEDEVSTLSTLARTNSTSSGAPSHGMRGPPSSPVVAGSSPSKKSEKYVQLRDQQALFDSKGRCVRHPNVRLRKRKFLGGWKVVMSACPDCCVDELKRLQLAQQTKRRRKSKEAGGGRGSDGEPDAPGDPVQAVPGRFPPLANPPAPRLASPFIRFKRTRAPSLDGSICTAALTASTSGSLASPAGAAPARDARKGKEDHRERPRGRDPSQARQRRRSIRVRGVEWVDPEDGRAGLYTGEANDRLVPHGWGELKYRGGGAREGEWEVGRYCGNGKSPGSSSGSGSRGCGVGSGIWRPSSRQRARPQETLGR